MIAKYFQELKGSKIGSFLHYLGPGFIITVGFIDPGNWAANIAAGSTFGYSLLWVVTLSTIMLIFLQYASAKLGVVTGLCLAESIKKFFPPWLSTTIIITAYLASISTVLAEILGGAIALNMLFNLPIKLGAILISITVILLLFSNKYKHIESWIIAFVSVIGFSFIYELFTVNLSWQETIYYTFIPTIPNGSIVLIMSVLGAVVMPHNIFLHSEFIQSRDYDRSNDNVLKNQLRYAKTDTIISMLIGFLINAAIVILAAATFYQNKTVVTDLSQAQQLLVPILGWTAAGVFAIALLASGVSSSITAGMSGGSISAGFFKEQYNTNDRHTTSGIIGVFIGALLIIFLIKDPFQGIILSQVLLSVQLPLTIISLLFLTGSKKVMGKFVDSALTKFILIFFAIIVIVLNVILIYQTF